MQGRNACQTFVAQCRQKGTLVKTLRNALKVNERQNNLKISGRQN